MFKTIITLTAGFATIALPAFSQSEYPQKNEVSVQAFGSFVKSTTDNGIKKFSHQQRRRSGQLSLFFRRSQRRRTGLRIRAEHSELPFAGRRAGREELFTRSVRGIRVPPSTETLHTVRDGGQWSAHL